MNTITPIKQPDAKNDGKKRTRSPAYPFISLDSAIKRAKEFYDKEQRHTASMKVAIKHWGYEEKSSGGLQTVAALLAFGLMQDEGSGDGRKLQLTKDAINYILDQRTDSSGRDSLLKKFALAPKIHQDLWSKWGAKYPSEETMRYTLTVEWEPPFNDNSVDGFIREYKDTISFAKLSESDTLVAEDDSTEGESEEPKYVPEIGDYVQWESQGVLQLKESAKVTGLSTDGSFIFIEGTSTGIPIGQVRRATAPEIGVPQKPQAREQTQPVAPVLPNITMKEDVYSLPEGRIVIQWPSVLSADSIQDVKDWLKLVERKISRSQAPTSEGQS